jgi:hypothetical protein
MAKSHDSALRWKKNNSIVTYVLPNSEVQPEVIGERAESPEFVSVHRVHEPFIRHIFGDSEIVDLRRVLTGNDIAQYEAWKAPHLPPIDRHTTYVFKDYERKRTSAPLYVCAPVQLTLEMKTDTSAKLGPITFAGARTSIGRERTYNVQVSAATDPDIYLEVTTPYQKGGKEDLVDLVRRYAYEVQEGMEVSGGDLKLDPEEIFDLLLKKYNEYIMGSAEIIIKAPDEPIHINEGESLKIPLAFHPQTTGKMLLIVAARDSHGYQVFSDFIGLSYNRRTRRLKRDF